MRLNKIQKWIASQREYLDIIYNIMKNTLYGWSVSSTKNRSNRLLEAIYAAPETPLNTPGYIYRKIVLYPRQTLNLNFNMARLFYEFFHVHTVISKSCFCFLSSTFPCFFNFIFFPYSAHSFSTTAGSCF